ncbi:MAG: 3-hydroxyacyl-CoA dehydrogenase NAD-binding domain-containing protein [Promethearchaeota archaeon]
MVNIDNIKNIAVVGGGILGSGIAQVALLSGYEKVTVIDLNDEILEKSRRLIQYRIKSLESEEKFKEFLKDTDTTNELIKNIDFKQKQTDFKSVGILANGSDSKTVMSRLKTITDLAVGVSDADFVIEAVSEIMELKQDIFRNLGNYTPTHTVLASNTSTMSITKISQFAGKTDKCIGMHFHTPFPIMGMLIEITPCENSSKNSLELGCAVAQKFPCLIGGRFTVHLEKESPGLIANRMAITGGLYSEWIMTQALEKGISYGQLETLGVSFEGIDALGVDTVYFCLKYFEENVSSDFVPSKRLTDLVKAGRFGKKVGKGFYEWIDDKPVKKLEPIDEESKKFLTELFNLDIFAAIQLNEACRLLEEGVVKSYELIDEVIMKGTFVPGPFMVGKGKYKEYAELLYDIAEKTGKSYLKPCEMMESGKFLSLQ